MKTRIKKVVNALGETTYYPQATNWFWWLDLWPYLYNAYSGERLVYSNLKNAQECIDNYIEQERKKELRKKKTITYTKYP